jgi:glycosyltransferase involved in cell wall biosynthesis
MPMEGLRRQHREALPFVDRFLAVSRFQRDRFVERYDLPRERFLVTRNGVDAERYRPWAPRVPGRLVYLSTPFRGLAVLLAAFPLIRAALPGATLDVWSGMAAYDQPDEPFRPLYGQAAATAGVTRHQPVPQAALIPALRSAELMVYPATFSETSCIAAMMAIAAGVPVVASDRAGLPETVGDCGVLVPGDGRRDPGYAARFAATVVALLRDEERRHALRVRCAARDLDWEPVVSSWWPLLVG